jgi:hypothetical protein
MDTHEQPVYPIQAQKRDQLDQSGQDGRPKSVEKGVMEMAFLGHTSDMI